MTSSQQRGTRVFAHGSMPSPIRPRRASRQRLSSRQNRVAALSRIWSSLTATVADRTVTCVGAGALMNEEGSWVEWTGRLRSSPERREGRVARTLSDWPRRGPRSSPSTCASRSKPRRMPCRPSTTWPRRPNSSRSSTAASSRARPTCVTCARWRGSSRRACPSSATSMSCAPTPASPALLPPSTWRSRCGRR